MNIKELEAELKNMKKQLQILQDIEEIQKVQRAYGVYIERGMGEEIIDLFADGPGVRLDFGRMRYLGKQGVRNYFHISDDDVFNKENPEFFHQVMQLAPIIEVNPDGKKATGRFNGFGVLIIPVKNGVTQNIFSCIYQNDYVKENGKWKIQVMRLEAKYFHAISDWVVEPGRLVKLDMTPQSNKSMPWPKPDEVVKTPPKFKSDYPTDYIMPYLLKHPVTGKETRERARNVTIYGKGIEELYK